MKISALTCSRLLLLPLACLALTAVTVDCLAQDDASAIKNADFSEWTGGKPDAWTFRDNKQEFKQGTDIGHDSLDTALQIDIVKSAGNSLGEILQKLKLEPYTRYKITADIKSTSNQVGMIQVKTIASKKEIERLQSQWSTTEWQTFEIEFDTANADQVQVLCRYRQKDNVVGSSVWWTNLTIEKLGEGAPPADPMMLEVAPAGSDQHVTPSGAGDRSGSSWDNARPADELSSAIEAAGAGHTVLIGSGDYPETTVTLTAGGDEGKPLTIRGVDTGGGLPTFSSNFDKHDPAKTGGLFLQLDPHVGFVTIEDLRLDGFKTAVQMFGPNRGVRVTNVDVTNAREGFILNGNAIADRPDSGSQDIIFKDCDITGYTKRGMRFRGGVHNIEVVNCNADSGGEEWAVENFPMGFSVEGSESPGIKDHDITFRNCTARNNWHMPEGNAYWNADGFCAERSTESITYIACGAFGNTDGGWDLKTANAVLIDCVSFDNKRNYRFWSHAETPAKLTNCIAGYANRRGGSGNPNGIHVAPGGGIIADHMTFVETGQGVDCDTKPGKSATATVTNSIFYVPDSPAYTAEDGGSVQVSDSIIIDLDHPGDDPQFLSPAPTWEGGTDAFNSTTYPDKGYRFTTDSEPS